MDADKEGFLRNHRSLIQVIGRAARNENGRVILYAEQMTQSMQKAIDETKRRRDKQESYNLENHITPKTIKKEITGGILDVLKVESPKKKAKKVLLQTPDQIDKYIVELTKKMKDAAQNLDFETAALHRDEIKDLQEMRKFV